MYTILDVVKYPNAAQKTMLNRGATGGSSARFGRPDENRNGYSGDQDVDMKDSHVPSRLAQPRSYSHGKIREQQHSMSRSSAGTCAHAELVDCIADG